MAHELENTTEELLRFYYNRVAEIKALEEKLSLLKADQRHIFLSAWLRLRREHPDGFTINGITFQGRTAAREEDCSISITMEAPP